MRWWLAATFALIAAVTAVAVTWITSHRTENALRGRATALAVGQATLATDLVAHALARKNVEETVHQIETRRRLAVFVFDPKGRLISSSRSRGIDEHAIKQRNEVLARALAGSRSARSADNGNATVVAVPLPGQNGAVVAYAGS